MDTPDSGMGTLQSQEAGPVPESLWPDTIIGRGIGGVDASTPILRTGYPSRPKQFEQKWSPMPDALPPRSLTLGAQPGLGRVAPQQATQWATE